MALRILYDVDTWDAATISSNSEAGDLVDDNIVHDFVGKVWRSTGDTSEWVVWDLGSASLLTVFGIFGHNFTAAATVTLQAHTADSWGAPSYSQVLTVATDADGVVLPQIVFYLSETYRYWRLLVADAANPDTYIQIGRVMAGEYYEPPRSYTENPPFRLVDPSEADSVPGAMAPVRSRPLYRTTALVMQWATTAQRDKMEAVYRKIGRKGPVLVSLDPTNRASEDSIYARIQSDLSMRPQWTAYNLGPITFEEKVS